MRFKILAALCLLLSSSGASAQGLIAFPWKQCPVVTGNPICVWVADAFQITPIRPREHTDRKFEIGVLNPGSDPAEVIIQVRAANGDPIESASLSLVAGRLAHLGSTVDLGYFVVQSDRPLWIWAWGWEEKMARGGGAEDRPPDAMSAHNIPVIPVDCSLTGEESKSFSFVCGILLSK